MEQLLEDYDKIKHDPMKLQLYNVKKKILAQQLQRAQPMPASTNNTAPETNKTIPHHSRDQHDPNNINKCLPTLPKKITPISYGYQNSTVVKYILVDMVEMNAWQYEYAIRRLTPIDTNNMCSYEVGLASIPSEHINCIDGKLYVTLYAFKKTWKEVTIMVPMDAETVVGTVIRCRARL